MRVADCLLFRERGLTGKKSKHRENDDGDNT